MKIAAIKKQQGFTLLEVLLVVAIIAVLAGIVILAISPGKNLQDSRNAQRRVDVNTILNAIYQYSLDQSGDMPTEITTTEAEICSSTGVPCDAPAAVDLGVLTASEKYLTAIPRDPQCSVAGTCASNGVGYTVQLTAGGRITVAAPDAEGGVTIEVTR